MRLQVSQPKVEIDTCVPLVCCWMIEREHLCVAFSNTPLFVEVLVQRAYMPRLPGESQVSVSRNMSSKLRLQW